MVCSCPFSWIDRPINFSTDIVYMHMDLNTRVRTMGKVYDCRSNERVL